jgi:glycosyltransferase involved in cell wall biosynthesis
MKTRGVVSFSVDSIPEWLEHGVMGFLVKPYEIKEMAQRIDFLLDNPAVAHEMGMRGRKRVEQDFNKDKHLSALLEIYRQVIDGRT